MIERKKYETKKERKVREWVETESMNEWKTEKKLRMNEKNEWLDERKKEKISEIIKET